MIFKIALIYFTIISLFAVVFTVKDKKRAVKNKWRVKERTLFLIAFLGGALAEYVTMKAIHHKTLHKKFMLGLPTIFIFQLILCLVLLYQYL